MQKKSNDITIEKFEKLKTIQPWCIDKVFRNDSEIRIKGWSYFSKEDEIKIKCNNTFPKEYNYRVIRKDLPKIFSFWNDAKLGGFECLYEIGNYEHLEFSKCTGELTTEYLNNYFYFEDDLPLPQSENMIRVAGSDLVSAFRLEGYSIYKKIKYVLENQYQFEFNKSKKILDWGCGCGRLTRYLVTQESEIWGSDIDQENLAWCEQNLKIKPILHEIDNQTSFPKNYFDVIIGISVMTHLQFELQLKWLEILANSVKKGGMLVLSTHGESCALRSLNDESFKIFQSKGYIDLQHNKNMEKYIKKGFLYRDVFNSIEFINNNWNDNYDISNIFKSVIGNNQDLVFLIRK